MEFELKQETNEVLSVKTVYEKDGETIQAIIKQHHTFITHLALSGPSTLTVNETGTFILTYQDWQGVPLPEENQPIKIIVIGSGQPSELILNPTNGQAEFDFESPIAGTFTIQATADFPCDPGILEVTVNE
ncbi:MAG TPA: hypothetical protein PK728_04535 [Bacillota bacterium]|nr:hypothetical protein [Bacillota bacterium]